MRASQNEEFFNPELNLIQSTFHSNGYHSKLPSGMRVHQTRTSADYALKYLASDDPELHARAAAIWDKLCSLQEQDPIAHTYGIWSWNYEEPLDQMDPPDWNWADFIGVRIAKTLKFYSDNLPAETVANLKTSLHHAAWSIFRRNVNAGYTNIAIMGSVVTAAAGMLLDEPVLVAYSRRRYRSIQESVEFHGSFVEYNSPTYTNVAIEEIDNMSLFIDDPEFNAVSDFLRTHAWEIIAEHFHPATAQWAGPHARAYHDLLQPNTTQWLTACTGVEIPCRANPNAKKKEARGNKNFMCPEQFKHYFAEFKAGDTRFFKRQFCLRKNVQPIVGTTWMDDQACLGSINFGSTWVQNRFIVGYWRVGEKVATLKATMLLNGREFPGFRLVQEQEGGRILSVFRPTFGTGLYHPTLNTVPEFKIAISDLRLRYSLVTEGGTTTVSDDGVLSICAGGYEASVQAAAGVFNEHAITWETNVLEDGVAIDGVLYHGEEQVFDFSKTSLQLAVGLSFGKQGGIEALAAPVATVDSDGVLNATWGEMVAAIQTQAEQFCW